jgi:mono/diheme cytochrome c family protein
VRSPQTTEIKDAAMTHFAGKRAYSYFIQWTLVCVTTIVTIALSAGPGFAQEAKKAPAPKPGIAGSDVARGQYLVEGVAMCATCHTPRLANGQLDRNRWLAGAPVPYQPSQARANWPTVAPRIAGLTPTSMEGMVKLLTTGIWIDGKQLRDPMPKFAMTKADAEAVVAYLKSVTQQH